jgi:hypothetical protein
MVARLFPPKPCIRVCLILLGNGVATFPAKTLHLSMHDFVRQQWRDFSRQNIASEYVLFRLATVAQLFPPKPCIQLCIISFGNGAATFPAKTLPDRFLMSRVFFHTC